MTTQETIALAGVMAPVLGGLITSHIMIKRAVEKRLERLELKTDAMWKAFVSRAEIAALRDGLGTIESPFYPTAAAQAIFAPIADELKEFYESLSDKLSEVDKQIAMEDQFRDWFLEHACKEHKWGNGQCIPIAFAIACGRTERPKKVVA